MTTARVYLLHLDPPYKHARHYVGWTGRVLEERLADHASGHGARMLRAHKAVGGGWVVARTWEFTGPRAAVEARKKERSLKKKAATRSCPICREFVQKAKGEQTVRPQ